MMTMSLAEVTGRKLNLPERKDSKPKTYGCKFCPRTFFSVEKRKEHSEVHLIDIVQMKGYVPKR